MKIIKYKILGYSEVFNPKTEIVERIENIAEIEMPYSESNLEFAKEEAYNGEYTIEDDGVEESTEPTQEERITELEEALDMLLNGVTE